MLRNYDGGSRFYSIRTEAELSQQGSALGEREPFGKPITKKGPKKLLFGALFRDRFSFANQIIPPHNGVVPVSVQKAEFSGPT
jgi:hypothetical protein